MPRKEPQSSFIPKTGTLNTAGARSGSGGSVLILIAAGLLALIIVASIGLFFYKQYSQSQLQQKQQRLQQARTAIDTSLITELDQLETRINTAKELLDKHVAVSNVFPVIESITLASVQFSSMKLSRGTSGKKQGSDNSSSGSITVNLAGSAPGYPAVVLQSSEIASHPSVINASLSKFKQQKTGDVQFSVQFTIPEKEVLYTNNL